MKFKDQITLLGYSGLTRAELILFNIRFIESLLLDIPNFPIIKNNLSELYKKSCRRFPIDFKAEICKAKKQKIKEEQKQLLEEKIKKQQELKRQKEAEMLIQMEKENRLKEERLNLKREKQRLQNIKKRKNKCNKQQDSDDNDLLIPENKGVLCFNYLNFNECHIDCKYCKCSNREFKQLTKLEFLQLNYLQKILYIEDSESNIAYWNTKEYNNMINMCRIFEYHYLKEYVGTSQDISAAVARLENKDVVKDSVKLWLSLNCISKESQVKELIVDTNFNMKILPHEHLQKCKNCRNCIKKHICKNHCILCKKCNFCNQVYNFITNFLKDCVKLVNNNEKLNNYKCNLENYQKQNNKEFSIELVTNENLYNFIAINDNHDLYIIPPKLAEYLENEISNEKLTKKIIYWKNYNFKHDLENQVPETLNIRQFDQEIYDDLTSAERQMYVRAIFNNRSNNSGINKIMNIMSHMNVLYDVMLKGDELKHQIDNLYLFHTDFYLFVLLYLVIYDCKDIHRLQQCKKILLSADKSYNHVKPILNEQSFRCKNCITCTMCCSAQIKECFCIKNCDSCLNKRYTMIHVLIQIMKKIDYLGLEFYRTDSDQLINISSIIKYNDVLINNHDIYFNCMLFSKNKNISIQFINKILEEDIFIRNLFRILTNTHASLMQITVVLTNIYDIILITIRKIIQKQMENK